MEGIILLKVEEESFELFKLGWISKSILVVVLVASLATTLFVKGNFARFVLFFAPKKRPLNILIMIDQVPQTHEQFHLKESISFLKASVLAPFAIIAVLSIASIALGSSLAKLANTEAICAVYWFSTMTYMAITVFGSCGIAVYRLITVKYESLARFVIGPKRLMVIVLALQSLAIVAAIAMCYSATHESETGLAMLFCSDRTLNYFKTIRSYQNEEAALEKAVLAHTVLMFGNIMVSLVELGSYGCIFIQTFQANAQTPVGLVSPNIMKQRHLNNVMTLGGQTLVFVSKIMILVLAICLVNCPFLRDYFEEAAIMVVVVVMEGIKSVVQLYSSPEMRRFMFNKND